MPRFERRTGWLPIYRSVWKIRMGSLDTRGVAARCRRRSSLVISAAACHAFAFGAANAFTNFKDDTYTQLVKAAGSEIDPAKRKQLYSQINDLILDQSFTMNVSSYLAVSVATAKVQGVTRAPTGGGPILVDAWLQ